MILYFIHVKKIIKLRILIFWFLLHVIFLLIKKTPNWICHSEREMVYFHLLCIPLILNYMVTRIPGMGHNSAEYLHSLSESFKLSFADTTWFCADMSQIEVPVSELLSKDYAAKRRSQIKPDRWTLSNKLCDFKMILFITACL